MAYFQTPGVALITGAGSGIGQATGNALALAGTTTVIFADINLCNAQLAAEASKPYASNPAYKPLAYHLDATSQPSIDALLSDVLAKVERIDYLINSAGVDVATYATTPDLDVADYDRVLETNAKSLLLVSQAVIKVMLAQAPLTFPIPVAGGTRTLSRGVIVNVTSGLGIIALPGKGAYTISKHAALGLTKQMAADLATRGIRINSVCPAWVRTAMFAAEEAKAPGTEALAGRICPNGRVAEADEVAHAVVFLLSPAASYVSGIGMVIDHGATLGGVRIG